LGRRPTKAVRVRDTQCPRSGKPFDWSTVVAGPFGCEARCQIRRGGDAGRNAASHLGAASL